MLSIVARIRVKPGKVECVKTEMLKMVVETVKEEGCVNYDLHQDNADPAVFIFYENWSGEDALQNHLKSPHVQAYIQATRGMIAEFAMNRLTRLA